MSLFTQKPTLSTTARPASSVVPATSTARPAYGEPRREVSEDIYDGIEKNPDMSRMYLDEIGDYVLEVIKLQDGYKPKGTKNAGKPFFGADFKVVSSTVAGFPAGCEGSWMSTENDFPEYHLKSINNLLSSILKVDSSQVNKSTVKHATSEENPAAGMLVRLKIVVDPKGGMSASGKPYTRKKFSPFLGDEPSAA